MKEVSITIDGETVRYRNGPIDRKTITWPGEGAPGAVLHVKGMGNDDTLGARGEWGLMQLLEKGKVQKGAPGTRMFRGIWDFSDEKLGKVSVTFQLARIDTPFFGMGSKGRTFMSIFRNKDVLPPRSIVARGGKCPR